MAGCRVWGDLFTAFSTLVFRYRLLTRAVQYRDREGAAEHASRNCFNRPACGFVRQESDQKKGARGDAISCVSVNSRAVYDSEGDNITYEAF
jgi:hypothetical protein